MWTAHFHAGPQLLTAMLIATFTRLCKYAHQTPSLLLLTYERGLTNMLMHKYRRFETQRTNYHTQSPMWSDYEILFIAIILTVCYNDSHWDKKAVWLFVPTNQANNQIIYLTVNEKEGSLCPYNPLIVPTMKIRARIQAQHHPVKLISAVRRSGHFFLKLALPAIARTDHQRSL